MKLYHISSSNINGKTLIPKVPNNILTKLGVEDSKTPRVSFAPTVDHALLAIGFNRLKTGPKELSVFEPANYNNLKIIDSKELSMKGKVPDADKTKEVWVLNRVKMKYVGKIRLLGPTNKFVEIKAGPHKIKNYYWKYKIIDGEL